MWPVWDCEDSKAKLTNVVFIFVFFYCLPNSADGPHEKHAKCSLKVRVDFTSHHFTTPVLGKPSNGLQALFHFFFFFFFFSGDKLSLCETTVTLYFGLRITLPMRFKAGVDAQILTFVHNSFIRPLNILT